MLKSISYKGETPTTRLNHSEFRARILASYALRVQHSKSWRWMKSAREINALLKYARLQLHRFLSRAEDSDYYGRLLHLAKQLILQNALFDEQYYRAQLKGVGLSTNDALEHFILYGWRMGLNPNYYFDCAFYLKQAAIANCPISVNPLLHYLLEGAKKGLSTSEYFDTQLYMATCLDLDYTKLNPLTHYLQYGIFEERITSQLSDGDARPFLDGVNQLPLDQTNNNSQFDLVFVVHQASRTGAPMLALAILKALISRGFKPLVVLKDGGGIRSDFAALAPILDLSRASDKRFELACALQNLMELGKLNSKAPVYLNSAENIQIVEVFSQRNFKVIALVHEFMHCYPESQQRKLLENVQAVVFSSEIAAASCSFINDYPCLKTVLPQGLLTPEYLNCNKNESKKFLLARLKVELDQIVILSCGTLEQRKGVDTFVKVATEILSNASYSNKVHFLWIGNEGQSSDQSLRWSLEDIARAGIGDRVHFLNAQDDLMSVFGAADLFLLPSRLDPLPCVLHMAMAAAIPVVTFANNGGAQEVLARGGGTIVPFGLVSKMVETVEQYIDDRQLRIAHGQRGKEVVSTEYRMEDYLKSLLELGGLSIENNMASHTVADVEAHYDRFNDHYRQAYGGVLQAYRPAAVDEMLELQMNFGRIDNGMRVLDAGCGLCGPAIYLASKKNILIDALTVSSNQAKAALGNVLAHGLEERIRVLKGDYHRLSELFEPESFDRIQFLESLCHSNDISKALLESRKVLKVDGCLLIKDFVLHDWSNDSAMQQKQSHYASLSYKDYSYQLVYLQKLFELLNSTGFKIVDWQINPFAGHEDPKSQLEFEELAGLKWRQGAGNLHIADSVMILASKMH